MQLSGIPTKFPIPFGNSAGAPYIRTIPVASQIGTNPGYASLTDGFVPLNMTPIAAGGIPPFGQDLNGILKQITQWLQWHEAGGPIAWDSTFNTSIGGYPLGALLIAAAGSGSDHWISLADNNSGNPDASADNWNTFGRFITGDIKFRPTSEVLPGWIKCNATTIGSPSSGAGQLATSSTQGLYIYLWNNFSNTLCPVTGGRGASGLSDFNANKAIQVLDLRGYSLMGMDTMGGGATNRLANVPITMGSITVASSLLGENLHTLTSPTELPAHTHGITDPTHFHSYVAPSGLNAAAGGAFQAGAGTINTGASATGITINSTGSGGAHNNVQNSILGTWYMKM